MFVQGEWKDDMKVNNEVTHDGLGFVCESLTSKDLFVFGGNNESSCVFDGGRLSRQERQGK